MRLSANLKFANGNLQSKSDTIFFMDPTPVTLVGKHVRLEPLSLAHANDLFSVISVDPSIWRWLLRPPVPTTLEAMQALVTSELEMRSRGALIPFAQIEPASGRAVGHTTYMSISRPDRGLEIGHTWIGKPWQRTGLNTEAKYLLLRHAFESLNAVRVQLKTDARNLQSQAAIERLGAVREGVLRKYQIAHDGYVRNTVLYSIIESEWPAVKGRLEEMMG
jgi:RimJ/RimL family protein N-acetyltransferase